MLNRLSPLRARFRPAEDIRADLDDSRQFDAFYFLMLVMSCLIALLGLLVNSPAVIIGAMLISPLMGPILACGLAFASADWGLGRKALRNAALSVVEAVTIAALATRLSPLREVTPEILARTNPNLMDLLIAFLSGVAGTLALASRKGGLTIVPGVAIATAVMPPLATTGFGLATGQWSIGWGGFMLFFTNLTAIVISAAAVFFAAGLRPHEEANHLVVRYRVLIATGVLLLLSVPLVRTLHTAAQQARLRRDVRTVLTERLERPGQARLSSVDFKVYPEHVQVDAVIHTSRFIAADEVGLVEALLGERLRRRVRLDVQQLRLETQDFLAALQARPAAPAPTPAPADTVGRLQQRLQTRLAALLLPAGVEATQVLALGQEGTRGLRLEVAARAAAPSEPGAWSVAAAALAEETQAPLRLRVRLVVGEPVSITFSPGAALPRGGEAQRLADLAPGPARADLSLALAAPAGGDETLLVRRLNWLRGHLAGHAGETFERDEGLPPDSLRVQLCQTLDLATTGSPAR